MSFDDFKSAEGGEPPDGLHAAYLERTAILDTKNGTRVKVEWRTVDGEHYWESWHGVTGKAKAFTQELVMALGINFGELSSWDELGTALELREGKMFEVSVSRNGDWLNTTVEGALAGVQEVLPDIPADTNGLPEPEPAPAGVQTGFDDDDIPF